MIKKHLAIALALAAVLLMSLGASGQACSSGAKIQAMGVGSSAQFNTLAYAASDVVQSSSDPSPGFNLMSFKAGSDIGVTDTRPPSKSGSDVTDSATVWVIWDAGTTCNVYAYFSVDSGVGVKDFQAAITTTQGTKTVTVGAAYPVIESCVETGSTCTDATFDQVGGINDTTNNLPGTVYSALTTIPATYAGTVGNNPLPYCGSVETTAGFYCAFNFAGTDIRPEDALFAATRALSSLSSTNSLAGLGYNQTGCGANSTNPNLIGCPVYDAFGQKKTFNTLPFALNGGKDPLTGATSPTATTVSVGAAPILVFVNNGDTANFGKTATTSHGHTTYNFHDILDKKLAEVFEGTAFCTGDLLTDGSGAGVPIQVVQREPLSGTYNTFEFTAVRTLYGSASGAVGLNKISSTQWVTDDASGQELLVNPTTGISGGCQNLNSTTVQVPNIACGDPLAIYSGPTVTALPSVFASGNSTAVTCVNSSTTLTGGAPLRLRAIGTSEEVPATLALFNGCTDGTNNTKCAKGVGGNSSGNASSTPFDIVDGIGYAFWSYGNFSKAATGCGTTNPPSCTSFIGHYISVSGVEPLWETEGGEFDTANVWGLFNLPQCNLTPGSTLGTLAGGPCTQLPFTHIYDGKYPLWSILRLVTFANVSGKVTTPAAVLNLAAYDQIEVNNSTRSTSDFVPFLKNICPAGQQWNGTACATASTTTWNGNLNLYVFRSHYKQSNVNPDNGHHACNPGGLNNTVFVNIVGGTKSAAACLVDLGGDVGGVPLTVQDDIDFNLFFGLNNAIFEDGSVKAPAEIYGLHQ